MCLDVCVCARIVIGLWHLTFVVVFFDIFCSSIVLVHY
jgi:hypothetical protein